jgi:hypothetical protein
MQEILGRPIVVENRAGASGSVGNGEAARAAPDGYTWLLANDTLGDQRHADAAALPGARELLLLHGGGHLPLCAGDAPLHAVPELRQQMRRRRRRGPAR